MNTLFTAVLATCFLFLGLLGLLLPVLPGFLFIIVAVALYAMMVPPARRALSRQPRLRRLFERLDHANNLDLLSRCKLAFWASLEAASPQNKSTK
ncbi:MAG: DUF454 family protein [Pseudomonadota bacterium]